MKDEASEAEQAMKSTFQIDGVDPSSLPMKQPPAKTKTILNVSHNADFPAHTASQ